MAVAGDTLLREVETDDAQAVLELLGTAETVAYMLFPVFRAADAARFVQQAAADRAEDPRSCYRFVATERVTRGTAGLAGLLVGPDATDAEIWYVVAPRFRGRGHATRVVEALVQFGFGTLKLHRIWANCVPANHASIRVLEKAGFRREGHFRENIRLHGRWCDSFHYAILEHEAAPGAGGGTGA
jgi:[ribosomal protein S5]-alanine N-acetyltransferase